MSAREERNRLKINEAFEQLKVSAQVSLMHKTAFDNAVYICAAGSRAYGTHSDLLENGRESDVDLRGVFIAEEKCYLGLSKNEHIEIKRPDGEKDAFMELRKFLRLALENNPNIIEQLFMSPECTLFVSEYFKPFIDNRELFLSKKCKHSYSGFSFSQMKRISGHYIWLTKPLQEPVREHYTVIRYKHKETGKIIPLSDYESKRKRILAIAESGDLELNENRSSFFEDLTIWEPYEDVDKDAWRRANENYAQYSDWKAHRNSDRAKLEADYGYDTKHAANLTRLLIQGRQILTEHTLTTKLRGDDLKLVNSVRNGKFSYPELIKFAEEMNNELESLYLTSKLRNSPEVGKIEQICIEVIRAKFLN